MWVLIAQVYTGSLVPADFSGAVFTCAHFQKIAQISTLCNFPYISEGTHAHAILVTYVQKESKALSF